MNLDKLPILIILFSASAVAVFFTAVFIIDRIKRKRVLIDSLNYVLYEIIFPESAEKPAAQGFREIISVMEQFYSGMAAVSEASVFGHNPYFILELALPHVGEETAFFAAVPKKFKRIFEKQLEGLFPLAHAEIKNEDYNIFNPSGAAVVSELKLEQNPALPIKTYRRLEADPLETIANAFSKLKKEGEGAAMQVVVYPAEKSFKSKVRHTIGLLKQGKDISAIGSETWATIFVDTINNLFLGKSSSSPKKGPNHSEFNEETLKLVEEKTSLPIFKANIRLVASAETIEESKAIMKELESAFLQFSEPQGNNFIFRRFNNASLEKASYRFSFRIFDKNSAIHLNVAELTSIFHFPLGVLSAPKLKMLKARMAPAPSNIPVGGLIIGKNVYRGEETEIRVSEDDRRRHMYIIGQTGTGKTEFIKNMIRQDISAGAGVCVIDPHGDMVDDLLGIIPEERVEDVIYFDPGNTSRPMGLNFLEYDPTHPEQRTFIVDELMQIFNKLYNMQLAGGPMFEQYFRNAAHLVMEDPESGNTLLEVVRVFTEKPFRDYKLLHSKNQIVNSFWKETAEKTGGDHALQNMVPYITSKFDTFLSDEIMRAIILQEKSAFRMRDVIDSKKILLVNLSKGRLGELNSSLLGLIIVGKILMASFSRVDTPMDRRNDFYLYLDEFQNVTTPSIATILSEARKYRLSLNIAHQFIGQLTDDIRKAVFGNVGTIVSFRIGREDAEFLEKHFEPVFTAHDLMNIENYRAYIKTLIHGKTVRPFNIETLEPVRGNATAAETIKELSALKYGTLREEFEQQINKKYQR